MSVRPSSPVSLELLHRRDEKDRRADNEWFLSAEFTACHYGMNDRRRPRVAWWRVTYDHWHKSPSVVRNGDVPVSDDDCVA
jgi:hypothetical protein